MPLPRVYRVCQDQQGNIVPNVLGSVFNQGTGVLAPLWNDDAGTVPLSNPMTSDASYGSFKFYINPGHYDLTFTKPGYTFEPIYDFQVVQDVLTLGTMATQNADAVAITGGSGTFTGELNGTAAIKAQDRAGSNQFGFVSYLSAAGGTDRWGYFTVGDAPHYLRGRLVLGPSQGGVANNQCYIFYNRQVNDALVLQPFDNDTGGGSALVFKNLAGSVIGSIATTAAATAYNTSSDIRLNHAVQPLTDALARVAALRAVAFRWNADDSPGTGYLAHELQQVIPEAVSGLPDAVNADGSIKPQQVDHSKLIPHVTAALQELMAQVQTLTARITTLEDALGV